MFPLGSLHIFNRVFDKGKEKGGFSAERGDSKKGVGPKNLFKTQWLNFLFQISIVFYNCFTDKRNKAKW